jgi:hypothetical protein
MAFRIQGLSAEPFEPFFGMPDGELAHHGVVRHVVDAVPGFPDRIELVDVPVGETVLLINHVYQPADTPYRASHAIFVREGAKTPAVLVDEVPDVLRRRLISLRAFDANHMMIDADVVEGTALAPLIGTFFANPEVAYLQAHFAKRGCFAARIDRT